MIRKIKLEELPTLVNLSQTTFAETFGKDNTKENLAQYFKDHLSEAILGKELRNPNSFFYFLVEKNIPVGFLKLNINDAQSEKMGEDTLEIERIYILKSAKRKGYGKQLFEHSIQVAKEQGKKKIWLGVWENNFPAKAFYEKQGFQKVGEHVFTLGEDQQTDEILLLAIGESND